MTLDHTPACPFCHAPWTEAMLAEFARFSGPVGCRCCSGAHHKDEAPALPVPKRDLRCAECGHAIYRKP
jgi:hypothetical protein